MRSDTYSLSIDLNAGQFLNRASSFLYEKEDIYSHILSLALASTKAKSPFSEPFWFASVVDGNGNIAACAVHATPDGLICTSVDDPAAKLIALGFQSSLGLPDRISGPPESVGRLKSFFDSEKVLNLSNEKTWTIYRIDHAPKQKLAGIGSLVRGTPDDEDLVRQWGQLYDREKPAFTSIEEFLVRKLKSQELFKWDYQGAKSLVTLSGKTTNGLRISALYTPPKFRGRGYATLAVSALASHAIENGAKFITLHAQHGDPVERLYKEIGFIPIGKYFSLYR